MYRGFNLKLDHSFFERDYDYYLKVGRTLHNQSRETVEKKILDFKDSQGRLIASKIVADWFPHIEADIFLSHSHKDENDVIALAGWLKHEFGLTSFVDSCVWGYSDELVRLLNNKYSLQRDGLYNYVRCNETAAHVHMMLSTALSNMINECECIIFVNTPNSITPEESVGYSSTYSPWIYSEIEMTRVIQKNTPFRLMSQLGKSVFAENASLGRKLKIQYEVNLAHLTQLSSNELNYWKYKNNNNGSASLDFLYTLQ